MKSIQTKPNDRNSNESNEKKREKTKPKATNACKMKTKQKD